MFGLLRSCVCRSASLGGLAARFETYHLNSNKVKFFGYFKSNSRFYSIQSDNELTAEKVVEIQPDQYTDEDFTPIYRFPYITSARLLSRLKLYQTMATVIFIPVTAYYYSVGTVGLLNLQMGVGLSSFAMCMLYIMSGLLRKIVGVISVTNDGKYARIGHMTFWGHRTNAFIPVNSMVPISDTSEEISDIYVKIKSYESPREFFLFIRHGKIVNKEQFARVFGTLM